MNIVSQFFMGVAMSADAFAAALGRGTALDRAKLTAALRIGAVFGLIESITPVVGWLIGNAAATMIQGFDHWVAFALLGGLGLHMIHAGLNPPAVPDLPSSERQPLWSIALTGFATSIDAMAVGVGLAFLDVNILMAAAIIGTCTFIAVTLGILLGQALGQAIGQKAEILGGLVLMLVGVIIVFEHTGGI